MSRPSRKNRDISARRRKAQDKGLPWAYILPAIVVIIVIVVAVYVETRPGTTSTTTYILPPLGSQGYPFQCLGTESLFMHIHPWLRIVILGMNVTIPGAIGIENPVASGSGNFGTLFGGGADSCFEPIHTHDFSGVIHIESPSDVNYSLSDFFNVWAQSYKYAYFNGTNQRPIVFNSTDILGFANNASYHVVLLVDGKVNYDYGGLVLNTLAYCDSGAPYNQPSNPCSATAAGAPAWNGGQTVYPYGTGHTIEIEYVPVSQS